MNDAKDWAQALSARGYEVNVVLDSQATRAGIVGALDNMIYQAGAPGDRMIFQYSGHGSWLPDRQGDEPDQRDEMICPHDVMSGKYLMDDDLDVIFHKKAKDTTLMMISDSCFSGSVSRFTVPAEDGSPEYEAPKHHPKPRFLPPLNFLAFGRGGGQGTIGGDRVALAANAPIKPRRMPAHVALLLSGCRDTEYSYDAYFTERPNGAMSRVAIDALQANPANAIEWMRAIRKILPSRDYPQTPVLSGTRKAQTSAIF